MSDKTSRPRRAWQADDDLQEPLVPITPAEGVDAPRRGAAPEGPQPGLGDDPVEPGAEPPLNPFARPGSAAEPAPMIPAPVLPRSAGEFADSPSPAPRRSALSGNTPVEATPDVGEPAGSWVAAHRTTLLKWALAGLVGALVVGLVAFFIARGGGTTEPAGTPSATNSPTDASPSATVEPAMAADLVTAEDLAPIAPAAEWSETSTTSSQSEHELRALCLSTIQSKHNPTHSFQRSLGTTGTDRLAALHRIDAYANPEAAQSVMAERIAALSDCTEVPVQMVRASTVSGLAEEAFQVTLLQDEIPAKYHTILLTRDGAALQLMDAARDGQIIEAGEVAEALTRPQTRIAEAQGAPAPADVAATPTVVPPAQPNGWLVPVDLPRLHPGVGRWTMTAPQPIDTRGMGCENMELATEAGPTERAKVTYSLTQDPQVPDRFGIDELLFTFPSPDEAAAFVTKLGANMHSCKDRVNTAEVEELPGVSPRDAEGNVLSARIFQASQAISDTARVSYQTVVGIAGNKVAYTLVSVSPDAQLTPEQLNELAARVTIRASQLPA